MNAQREMLLFKLCCWVWMTLNFEISLQLFNQFDAEGEGYADVETFLEVILYTVHV